MRKLLLSCLASGLFCTSLQAQAQTLFTYGNHPVSKEEFLKVYQENSLNKPVDYSDSALHDYLDLYSLFRMKVTEAEKEHLDTLPSIEHELDNYRRQLARSYLTDEQVTNRLIKEAYNRMKEDVRVAHILIMCRPGADTVAAYKKIDSIYNAIETHKADFAAMAKEYSEDKASGEKGGDIGYITALQTTYPFENAAYNTPVGKVSKPFRTQFGFHIVKVLDKRPARGQVQVAQILIATPKSKGEEGMEAAHKRADSIVTALKNGASFDEMVKDFSNDRFTVNENGVMQPFGVGQMVPAFENAAFALNKPGEISEPVQTEYGFHIIKLIKKIPLQPYDSMEAQLKHKIENDYRAEVARNIFFEKVKQRNGFKEYPQNLDAIINRIDRMPDTGKNNAHNLRISDFVDMNAPVFTLAGKDYKQSDFINYAESITRGRIMGNKKTVIHDLYNMYVSTVVNDFEEHRLADENPAFKDLMEKYRNGIMLFELMDRNVWGKASKDSAGLEAFYNAHKSKYMWEPGFIGSVYKFKDEEAYKKGIKLLRENIADTELVKRMNTAINTDAVSITHGHYEFSRFKGVPESDIKKGQVTEGIKNPNGSYTVVRAEEVYTMPTQKTLDEARGYVVAEYQDYLEKNWNEQMRDKYPMKVNKNVFASMVKK